MFFVKPQKAKIKPTLFPGPSLLQKLQRNYSDSENFNIHNACLLKYFPKYHRNLEISLTAHSKSAQHRVALLKIIHKFHYCQYIGEEKREKTLKRLIRTSRKTLKSLPIYENCPLQRHSLSLYFPRVSCLDLSYNQCFKGEKDLGVLPRSVEKEFYRAHGYFWDGNRSIKKLKITNQNLYYWVMLKKLDESKRFLESLETLQLSVNRLKKKPMARGSLIELLKNKEVLEYVTHLKFDEHCRQLMYFWQLTESLINSCHKLSFLSMPIYLTTRLKSDFSLKFCRLERLQELELGVNNLAIFISGVELPQSLRKMTFKYMGHMPMSDLPDIFGGSSLEKYQIQQDFFNKWKKLDNLKALKLIMPICDKFDKLLKTFVVPLLKAIPQLETFVYKWFEKYFSNSSQSLNLDVLLEGIESLRSFRNLKISPDFKGLGSSLIVACNPQKVYFLLM